LSGQLEHIENENGEMRYDTQMI